MNLSVPPVYQFVTATIGKKQSSVNQVLISKGILDHLM